MGLSYRPRTALGRYIRNRFLRRSIARPQVIGICRFSYPALGGFKIEHDDPRNRAAYLYDPVRLEERFRQFEAFTLPSLRAQTDQDFTFLIVIGQDFPGRARLESLVADLPQVQITALPPIRHWKAMKQAIEPHRVPGVWSLQFRLDDDDAIAASFVAKIRRAFVQHQALFSGSRHVSVSFSRGAFVTGDATGLRVEPAQVLFPAVGQAIGFRPDVSLCLFNFAHHTVWQNMPTITRTDPWMWLRGVNDHNDSGDPIGQNLARPDAQTLARLQRDFGISETSVRAVWSGEPSPALGTA